MKILSNKPNIERDRVLKGIVLKWCQNIFETFLKIL